jgi:fructosamine-3-kinase
LTLPPGASAARSVGGGDINDAYRVLLADGSDAFVKTREQAGAGEYADEAAGLCWLGEPGALRTPRVLDVAHDYLALEWIEQGALTPAGAEELGAGLASTHAAGASRFGGIEGSGSARFGPLQLPNDPTPDWPAFYAERRLLPLARAARERRSLSATGGAAVERVCERLADIAGPPEPPARLHGDLWSGNVIADRRGRPWLVDPCVYGGHREIDLAMLSLFGGWAGLDQRVLAAYQEHDPLADGWRERVELYQLLPLLVHTVLFGGSYGRSAERAALRYAS